MPLTEVIEMAKYIGEKVKNPELPKAVYINSLKSGGYPYYRWPDEKGKLHTCPMGLLLQALCPSPGRLSHFTPNSMGKFTSDDIRDFGRCWDKLESFQLPLALKQIWSDS